MAEPNVALYWDERNEMFSLNVGTPVADDDESYPERQVHLWGTFGEANAFCLGLDVHDDPFLVGVTPAGTPVVVVYFPRANGRAAREDHRG